MTQDNRSERFVEPVDDIVVVSKITKCSECERWATHSVSDVRDITPDGQTYSTYQLYGQVRHGCEVHPQQASVYDAEGRLLGLVADL